MDVCSKSAIKELCNPYLVKDLKAIWDTLKDRFPYNDNDFCQAIYRDLALSLYVNPYYSLKYIEPDKPHSPLVQFLLSEMLIQSISHITTGSILASAYVSMLVTRIVCNLLQEENMLCSSGGWPRLCATPLAMGYGYNLRRIGLLHNSSQAKTSQGSIVGVRKLLTRLRDNIHKSLMKEHGKISDIAKAERIYRNLLGKGRLSYGRHGSLLSLLEDPSNARKVLTLHDNFIKASKSFMHEFPDTLAEGPFQFFYGVKSGVMKMIKDIQIRDILPHELAYFSVNERVVNALGAVKLATRQMQVYERIIGNIHIFIDKSGSMNESMKDGTPKISAAAALAHVLYRRYKAKVYAFDTEVYEIRGDKVASMILRLKATGGTNIGKVLEKIMKIKRKDSIYIIITDAIDYIEDDVIKKLKSMNLNKYIVFILVPPGWEEQWLRENFKYYHANDVAQLASSVKKVIL